MLISDWISDVCSSDLVGRETLAVFDVVDLDALVLADAGDVEHPSVDRARAFVMQLRMGDRGAVDLGFEQGQLHGHGPWGGGRRRILQDGGASTGSKATGRRNVIPGGPASTASFLPLPLRRQGEAGRGCPR